MLSVRYDWIHNGLEDNLKLGGADLSGTRDFDKTTGRVGVTWNPSPTFGAYAAWGQGFLPPTTRSSQQPGAVRRPEPAARPGHLAGGEVGVRGELGDTLAYEASAFHLATMNDFGRYRIPGRRSRRSTRTPARAPAGASRRCSGGGPRGCSGSSSLHVERFTYDTVTTITGETYTGTFLPNSPANLTYLDAELRPTPHWVVGASLEYQSRSYVDPSNEVWTDPYTLVNLRAAYQWRAKAIHGEVVGSVRNLFNTSYIAFSEPDPDGNSYHPGPTREAFLGVRLWIGTL